MDAVKASASERKREHEAKLQRQILDWIEVHQVKPDSILVLRVPEDKFIYPGAEEWTPEQEQVMRACHQVITTLVGEITKRVRLGGAAILSESMKLEDLPPPVTPSIPVARSQIVLPPGTVV